MSLNLFSKRLNFYMNFHFVRLEFSCWKVVVSKNIYLYWRKYNIKCIKSWRGVLAERESSFCVEYFTIMSEPVRNYDTLLPEEHK